MRIMKHTWPLLSIVLAAVSASSTPERWLRVGEDLSEYTAIYERSQVASAAVCVALGAARTPLDAAASLVLVVRFSQGSCRLFSCTRGVGGCRKCRNFANASLPDVWIRSDPGSSSTLRCWRTFLHRVDESVDFYLGWAAYKAEFGQGEDLNYWMGLERLHQLTSTPVQPPRVRWEFSLWNGSSYWAENTQFRVLNESQKYQALLGPWDASVSNVVQCDFNISWNMNGSRFSTPDSDNDAYLTSCAVTFHGAWWYKGCHCFNPTGRYLRPPLALNLSTIDVWATGITYFTTSFTAYPFNHFYSMMSFEALIDSQWP